MLYNYSERFTMKKIKFLFKRIISMDYKGLFETVKEVHKRTGKNSVLIFFDVVYCGLKYQAGYLDYLDFEFYQLNAEQKASYVTRGVSNHYVRTLNDPQEKKLLENKAVFLKHFSDVSGRSWFDLENQDFESFEIFFKEQKKIVAKPKEGVCGRGIEFFEYDGNNARSVYDHMIESGQLLAEELLIQHDELAKIHPYSVNTIRVMSIQINGKVVIPYASLRTGNGKGVDNLNNGGFVGRIDIDTGRIYTDGIGKYGMQTEKHPLTGVAFKGFEIPRFDEVLEIVEKVALKVPKVGFVGWDVAILNDRVVVVEGNEFPGHDIYQLPLTLGESRMGMKPVYDKIIAELQATKEN